ncbi:DMT family transporter [Yoonia sp. 208BN28-4]|uniref:DMT family transporter n=1 Tax=Yoonia sp. 208BN28-4 TaxID=3126505 RepID=UPI0030A5E9E5
MDAVSPRPGLAVICALSAMMLFGLIDNFMRLAAETGGLWQFHLLRSAIALVCLAAIAGVMRFSLWPKRPLRVALRSVLTAVAFVIYFGCLAVLPIGQVVAGLFTAPIFVVIFSVVFFGERVGMIRVLAVAIGFTGIWLIVRPDTTSFGALTVLPVAAGAFYAMGNIATRRWCAGEATLTLLAGFFGTMLIFGALGLLALSVLSLPPIAGAEGFATRGWVPFTGTFMVITVVQGVGSLIGVGLSIRAYQMADPGFVAVFDNTLLIFATIWAVVLWGERPDALMYLGLACVALAGIIIALRSDQGHGARAVPQTD